MRAQDSGPAGACLVLDEVQKVTGWAEVVKGLWDADTASDLPLKVLLLGAGGIAPDEFLRSPPEEWV